MLHIVTVNSPAGAAPGVSSGYSAYPSLRSVANPSGGGCLSSPGAVVLRIPHTAGALAA
jgi:hypothetical protein